MCSTERGVLGEDERGQGLATHRGIVQRHMKTSSLKVKNAFVQLQKALLYCFPCNYSVFTYCFFTYYKKNFAFASVSAFEELNEQTSIKQMIKERNV